MRRSTEKMMKWVLGLGAVAGLGYLGYEKVLPARFRVKVGSTVHLAAGHLQTNAPIAVAQDEVMTVKVTGQAGDKWTGDLLGLAGVAVRVPVSFLKSADVVSVA
jgi:hypothetical protein